VADLVMVGPQRHTRLHPADRRGHDGPTDPHAVLLVELDGLARITETLGDAASHEVLQQAAERIRRSLRSGDFSAPWRGAEFVVALGTSSMDAAVEVAQRIRVAVSQPMQLPAGQTLIPTCTVGCAADGTAPMADLVASARTALDDAKAIGRNCVRRARSLDAVAAAS
jgi:diguanylate cyclase (GGDEF)-like protein